MRRGNRAVGVVVGLTAGLCVGLPGASGQATGRRPPPPPSETNLRAKAGTTSSTTVLSFDCQYVREGEPGWFNYDKVRCRFATTGISRPAPEQVAARLQQLAAPTSSSALAAEFQKACKAVSSAPAAAATEARDARQAYQERLAKACAAQDLEAGKEALRFGISEIWANTCRLFNYGPREYEFDKVDDHTWRAMDGAASSGSASIRTLWKPKTAAATSGSWNYKQVTSGDPSCVPSALSDCPRDSSEEWSKSASIQVAPCLYFD